jgi:hypothetical protein
MSEYTKQANDFLTKHQLEFTAEPAGSMPPPWHEPPTFRTKYPHGLRYAITIKRVGRGHCSPISFDFWGSINDREKKKQPTAYDVLACISSDVNCPETFEDFCSEYGYDEDSRKAFAQFETCAEFGKKLRAFFTEDEREELAEIQ